MDRTSIFTEKVHSYSSKSCTPIYRIDTLIVTKIGALFLQLSIILFKSRY